MDRNFWWVEGDRFFYYVALRKESVDRNRNSIKRCLMSVVVALRKESVDRNLTFSFRLLLSARRSPQGERG